MNDKRYAVRIVGTRDHVERYLAGSNYEVEEPHRATWYTRSTDARAAAKRYREKLGGISFHMDIVDSQDAERRIEV